MKTLTILSAIAMMQLTACTQGVDSLIPAHQLTMLQSEAYIGEKSEFLFKPEPIANGHAKEKITVNASAHISTAHSDGAMAISVAEMLKQARAYHQRNEKGL